MKFFGFSVGNNQAVLKKNNIKKIILPKCKVRPLQVCFDIAGIPAWPHQWERKYFFTEHIIKLQNP